MGGATGGAMGGATGGATRGATPWSIVATRCGGGGAGGAGGRWGGAAARRELDEALSRAISGRAPAPAAVGRGSAARRGTAGGGSFAICPGSGAGPTSVRSSGDAVGATPDVGSSPNPGPAGGRSVSLAPERSCGSRGSEPGEDAEEPGLVSRASGVEGGGMGLRTEGGS